MHAKNRELSEHTHTLNKNYEIWDTQNKELRLEDNVHIDHYVVTCTSILSAVGTTSCTMDMDVSILMYICIYTLSSMVTQVGMHDL